MGLGGYYGHYQGHWMSATAFLYNSTGNATVKKLAAENVDTLAKVMAAWKAKYGYDGYLFPYDPLVWDKLLAGHGAYPYVIHSDRARVRLVGAVGRHPAPGGAGHRPTAPPRMKGKWKFWP